MSMPALAFTDPDPGPADPDHIVFLRDVSWDDYEQLLRMRGDHSAPRINFLDGEVEIMSPSRTHEHIKSMIGRLIEAYCLEIDIPFRPLGSWTLKAADRTRGAEADECYIFGADNAERPHLAVEVVWTSGRIDKLDIYRKLGVPEVLYWGDGRLQPYVLRDDHYQPVDRSLVLPEIDLALLASMLDRPTAYDAIRDYRRALQTG